MGKKRRRNRVRTEENDQEGAGGGREPKRASQNSCADGIASSHVRNTTDNTEWTDFNGVGGPLAEQLEMPWSRSWPDYPGHQGESDRRDQFRREEQLVRAALSTVRTGASTTTAERRRREFATELLALVLLDPADYADTDLVLEYWLTAAAEAEQPTVNAHVYYAAARGVRLLPKGTIRAPTETPNYYKKENEPKVHKELERQRAGRIIKPVPEAWPAGDVLAVGEVDKDDGTVRLVLDASRGNGNAEESLNADIALGYVWLPKLEEAGRKLQRGDHMIKADAKDYFLNFGLRSEQFVFVMLRLRGQRWHYARLPLGIRNSMRLAQGFSEFITRVITMTLSKNAAFSQEDLRTLVAYCDDWFSLAGTKGTVGWVLATWMHTATKLGFVYDSSKPDKIIWPTQRCKFLGIILCAITLQFIIDAGRQTKLVTMIAAFRHQRSVSVREVQQLHGHVNFALVALPEAKTLLFHVQRLLGLDERRAVHLHPALKDDLELLEVIISSFNGKEITATTNRQHLPFDVTAAASEQGGCFTFGGWVFMWGWTDDTAPADLITREVRVIRMALQLCGPYWAEAILHCKVGSEAAQAALNGDAAHRSLELQQELSLLSALKVRHSIVITCSWWSSDANSLCEAGCRAHVRGGGVSDKTALWKEVAAWRLHLAATGRQRWVWRQRGDRLEARRLAADRLDGWIRARTATDALSQVPTITDDRGVTWQRQ